VAEQVPLIKHWTVIHGRYHDIADVEATWFIDPPYFGKAGSHYKHGSDGIDYADLGLWCRSRRGQVMVCENDGACWLPFEPFLKAKSTTKKVGRYSMESIWINKDEEDGA
jgi:hypothetical protein